jgi:hypothetical protein
MTVSTRSRRFSPAFDLLHERIAPSGGTTSPMAPDLISNPPASVTPPANTCPMDPVLLSTPPASTVTATT